MSIARAVLALALLAASRAEAGHVVEMTAGDGHAMTLQIEGDRWRIDNAATKGHHAEIVIFQGQTQTFVMVEPETKTYRSIDRAQVEGRMAEANAQMKERLAKMPPEQRRRIEEALNARGGAKGHEPAPVSYVKTARTGSAAGHRCTFYKASRGTDPDVTEVCIASFAEVGVRKEDFRSLMEFRGFSGQRGSAANPAWANSPGFPLIVERREADGKLHEETKVTSVKRAAIPASAFEVPAGFTRKKSFGD